MIRLQIRMGIIGDIFGFLFLALIIFLVVAWFKFRDWMVHFFTGVIPDFFAHTIGDPIKGFFVDTIGGGTKGFFVDTVGGGFKSAFHI